jgi:hypothetical protein
MFFTELFCAIVAFSTFLFCSEISNIKSKSFFVSLINSAFSVCGILYTILFKYIGYWRYVFIINVILNALILVVFIIYSKESFRFYLGKNDFKKFIESLMHIAKKNDLIVEFKLKLEDKNSEEFISI